MKRISVIRGQKIVPLFPNKPTNNKVSLPGSGLILEAHALGPVEIPDHEHSSYCLSLITHGPVEHEWWSGGQNGKDSHATGSMIFVGPGTRHRTSMDRPFRQLLLSMEESYVVRAAQEMGISGVTLMSCLRFEDPQLRLLMVELQREMESGWQTGALYHEHLGLCFSIALIQKFGGLRASGITVKGGIPRVRLHRVLEYIAASSDRDITLAQLAEVAGMSRFHFARLFRTQMGMTPHRYVINERLERAKALLRIDASTVKDIAAETGFMSTGQFSRTFRQYVGVSPTEWKRNS